MLGMMSLLLRYLLLVLRLLLNHVCSLRLLLYQLHHKSIGAHRKKNKDRCDGVVKARCSVPLVLRSLGLNVGTHGRLEGGFATKIMQ